MPRKDSVKYLSAQPQDDLWPTYQNMVAKFKQLLAMGKTGDQVYIHYSGHGGKVLHSLAATTPRGDYSLAFGLVPVTPSSTPWAIVDSFL